MEVALLTCDAAVLLVTVAQGCRTGPGAGRAGRAGPRCVRSPSRNSTNASRAAISTATRPVSITLSEPTPITDLLLMLVRDTRLSVVPDPDVQGTFRGELNDVTLRQALEMILQPHGYDYSVQGNLIRVFKRRFETRRFDLNYVITRRSGSRTLSASNAHYAVERAARPK